MPNSLTRRRFLARLGLAGAALSLAACGQASPSAPTASTTSLTAASGNGGAQSASSATSVAAVASAPLTANQTGKGGTLTIGMTAGNVPIPDTPPDQGYEGTRFVGYQIYDGLANYDLNQGTGVPKPIPGLATSWSVGADKLTWTLKLRQGVKFHDGTDFNADAVIFQLDRIMNKDFQYFSPTLFGSNRSNTLMIDSYRAVNPSTVEIKTSYIYAFMPWILPAFMIPSPTAVKKYGNKDYINHATGTGPFQMTKYVDGQVMELTPFAQYWGGKPALDKIVLRPMPDAATRLASLQSGEINWAEVPPPDSVKQLKATGYQVLLKEYPHTILLMLNVAKAPLSNVKVRQAMEYAIDRKKMANNLLDGVATPAGQLMYPGHAWYTPGTDYSYDPAKAKQLLADAGFAQGVTISMAYPTSGSGNMWPGPMMEEMQADYKAVGITMNMTPIDWNNIITMYRNSFADPAAQKYDGLYFSVAPITPVSALTYASWRIPPAGCCNPMLYKAQPVDDLLKQSQEEFDDAKQNTLIQKAMALMAVDAPVTFVVHDLNLRVLSPKVQGFIQPQSWFADLTKVWIGQ